MKNTNYPRMAALLAALAFSFAGPAPGQILNTLYHSIHSPTTELQAVGRFGQNVAMEGNFLVVGAPGLDIGTLDAGRVLVYQAQTGALLHTLAPPEGMTGGGFGGVMALSGSRLVVGGSSKVAIYDLAGATPTAPVRFIDRPPVPPASFSTALALSGSLLAVGARVSEIGSVQGFVHVFNIDSASPGTPIATLSGPVVPGPIPNPGDGYGSELAVLGNRVAVGAALDDTGATDAGRVYLYDMSSATPAAPVATINNPAPDQPQFNNSPGDSFGSTLLLAGTRLIIGAPGDKVANQIYAGSVYVYDAANPAAPLHNLLNPSPNTFDNFGLSLAIAGSRLVVGSMEDAGGININGIAYVYDLNSGNPGNPVLAINNPTPVTQDSFGSVVAIAGSRVAVSAIGDDTAGTDSGSVYTFNVDSATPTAALHTLNYPLPATSDEFGSAVAISGERLLVGVPRGDIGANDAGSAYLYDLAAPSTPAYVFANPAPEPGQYLGSVVALSGTLAVVGAPKTGDPVGSRSGDGRVYVYDLAGSSPATPAFTFSNPNPGLGEAFGTAVAVAGTRIAVGTPYDKVGGTISPSVHLFDIASPTPGTPVRTFKSPSPSPSDGYGNSLAISSTRVLIGAVGDDTTGPNAGRAWLYNPDSATPTVPVLTLQNPVPSGHSFGWKVAISGTRLLVTSYDRVFVYDYAGASPAVPVLTLANPGIAGVTSFPNAAALSGNVLVASGYNQTTGKSYSFVYDLGGVTPGTPIATLSSPGAPSLDQFGDQFGSFVSVSGNLAAMGTPGDDTVAPDRGAVYIFGLQRSEISVEQPAGAGMTDGSGKDFGVLTFGDSAEFTFTVNNSGEAPLTGLGITIDGPNASDFTLTALPAAPLAPLTGSTTFKVRFAPAATGAKSAALHIASNDADENPFDLFFTAQAHRATDDTDGDGLNDLAEAQLSSLGFDWRVAQPGLVTTLGTHANTAGYFTPSQLQALHVVPLLTRDEQTGRFKVRLAVEKSSDLINFTPFPLTAPLTTLTPDGKIEFEFDVPGGVTFIRVQPE